MARGWASVRRTNIDLNPDVRVDLHEDVVTLPSFEPDSVDEIYAGHIAEHLADVDAALRRWLEMLNPGGILTVTVPDGEGAMRLWRSRASFPVVVRMPAPAWSRWRPAIEITRNRALTLTRTGCKPIGGCSTGACCGFVCRRAALSGYARWTTTRWCTRPLAGSVGRSPPKRENRIGRSRLATHCSRVSRALASKPAQIPATLASLAAALVL
jgi:hypothetical protein